MTSNDTTASEATPDDTQPAVPPVGAFRIALRTSHLAEAVTFYRDLVGLPLLFTFEPGADNPRRGAGFGVPGASVTLELTSADGPAAAGEQDEIVLYLPGPEARDAVTERLTGAGLAPATPVEYWVSNDSVAFLDPDGRMVIFAPWVFGAEPPPASRKRLP